MAVCSNCSQVILFGGIKHEGLHFCSKGCFNAGEEQRNIIASIPEESIREVLDEVHQGACPKCQGPGPVDVHFSYRVISLLVVTQFNTIPQISCTGCANRAKIKNMIISGLFGWWGVPFGLISTPFYLFKNFAGLLNPVSPHEPSDELKAHIKNVVFNQYTLEHAGTPRRREGGIYGVISSRRA